MKVTKQFVVPADMWVTATLGIIARNFNCGAIVEPGWTLTACGQAKDERRSLDQFKEFCESAKDPAKEISGGKPAPKARAE